MPIEKLCAAFGLPLTLGDDSQSGLDTPELCYADWFLTLQPLAPSLGADNKDDAGDEALQFAIKANGEDLDLLTSLASFCILNAVVQHPEVYALRPPSERLVQCEIVHHAAMTQHLLAYLEEKTELPAGQLEALAEQRAKAVMSELVERQRFDRQRAVIGPVEAAQETADRRVAIRLDLGV